MDADIAVVGAGPVGCVPALSLARIGARVLVLESTPASANGLAGEWIHPPGARVLESLGLGGVVRVPYPSGQGFVVFPDDGSDPIRLPYPAGLGFAREHRMLVGDLRDAVRSCPEILFVQNARATAAGPGRLTYVDPSGERTSRVERIIGADGRTSMVRRWLGGAEQGNPPTSTMAGLLLDNAELPFEGYGHVALGGPGPMLIYRVDAERVRVCIDVPHVPPPSVAPEYLWREYHHRLPAVLRPAFRNALSRGGFTWAANHVRRRRYLASRDLALVGDAVGYTHPLTAVGMTLGFADAECLTRTPNFFAYRRERTSRTGVAEWLADALYAVFARRDDASDALRRGIYRLWRENPMQRDITLRLLTGDDTRAMHFTEAFARVLGTATLDILTTSASRRNWSQAALGMRGIGAWGLWLLSTLAPRLAPSAW
jgi:squalene monooxygenase